MNEGPDINNNFENSERGNVSQTTKADIKAIFRIQDERSLSKTVESKGKEDVERSGFLVHMLSKDELEKIIDMPHEVITISYKEDGEVLGYAIGYSIKLWKELHPDWLGSIHFSEGFSTEDIQDDSVYLRHVAVSSDAKVGAGAQISKDLLRQLEERGSSKVFGEILKKPYLNRPSTAVHIRLGFREIGEINEAFEGAEYTWGLFQKILKGVEEQR